MTQRLKGVTVAFDADIRIDDAEAIIAAIRQIRHVAAVAPVEYDSSDWIARQRVAESIRVDLVNMYDKLCKGDGL